MEVLGHGDIQQPAAESSGGGGQRVQGGTSGFREAQASIHHLQEQGNDEPTQEEQDHHSNPRVRRFDGQGKKTGAERHGKGENDEERDGKG
jgi:hypothetical protein